MRITIAHSPDSDDAFMFYGFASGAVDTVRRPPAARLPAPAKCGAIGGCMSGVVREGWAAAPAKCGAVACVGVL